MFIDGKLLDEPYLSGHPDGVCTMVKQCGVVKIPQKQYYLLGDNREASLDSRFIGLVNEESIKEKVIFVLTP